MQDDVPLPGLAVVVAFPVRARDVAERAGQPRLRRQASDLVVSMEIGRFKRRPTPMPKPPPPYEPGWLARLWDWLMWKVGR